MSEAVDGLIAKVGGAFLQGAVELLDSSVEQRVKGFQSFTLFEIGRGGLRFLVEVLNFLLLEDAGLELTEANPRGHIVFRGTCARRVIRSLARRLRLGDGSSFGLRGWFGGFGNQSEVFGRGRRCRGRVGDTGEREFQSRRWRGFGSGRRRRLLGKYTGGKEGGESERGVDGFHGGERKPAR